MSISSGWIPRYHIWSGVFYWYFSSDHSSIGIDNHNIHIWSFPLLWRSTIYAWSISEFLLSDNLDSWTNSSFGIDIFQFKRKWLISFQLLVIFFMYILIAYKINFFHLTFLCVFIIGPVLVKALYNVIVFQKKGVST